MRSRFGALIGALLICAGLLAGCSMGREASDGDEGLAAEVIALRSPMAGAVMALEELSATVAAGDLAGGQAAYQSFTQAFGEVLGPISLHDAKLAQQMALANVQLRELLGAGTLDLGQVTEQARILTQSMHQAAERLGMQLTAAASVHVGVTEADGSVTLVVTAREYQFTPPRLEVKRGTKVTVRLENKGREKHEWEVEELDLEIHPVAPGETGEITFRANRAGTYEFICDIADHYERGMKGQLIIR